MSYSDLYDRVEGQQGKISTRWLRDQVIDITPINLIKEQWTGLIDIYQLRGFYVEGPLEPPVSLNENESLIVLARNLNRDWRRIVYTKELMHTFDTPEEKTDTAEKFDLQAEALRDPSTDLPLQVRAEIKAFWRALGVLCNSTLRGSLRERVESQEMSHAVAAAQIRIPEGYIRHIVRPDCEEIIQSVM